MVEYILDVVRGNAGEDIGITAVLTDCQGKPYAEGCYLTFADDAGVIIKVPGLYIPETEVWTFIIPKETTEGLQGRYWYQIYAPDMSLNFKTPIYLK